MPPLITIGLTAFNAETHIVRALTSAVGQSWEDLEIIVVDDGSKDSTAAVIEKFAISCPQIRFIRQLRNTGVASARNRIIDEARGEFIAFFDDDDVSDPNRISVQYERIVAYEREFGNNAAVVCHTARRQRKRDGSERIERTMGCLLGRKAPNGNAVAARILWGKPLADGYGAVATCSQMARTVVYRELKGFDSSFQRSEDMEFCVRLAIAGGHFVGVAEPLVIQTLTHGSDKSLEKELQHKLRLIDKHQSSFESRAHYLFSRNWMEIKFLWLQGKWIKFVSRLAISATAHPLLTLARLWYALPQLDSNRSFSLFHRK